MTKKTKQSQKKSQAKKGNNAPRQAVVRRQPGLDPSGAAWARLLADPCSQNLVHPVYGGSTGGYLVRCVQSGVLGGGAGITSAIVHWTPGAIGTTNSELLAGASTGGGVGAVIGAWGVTAPGKTFISAQASGVRCVAACLEFSYIGAESTRAGRVHFGQTMGGLVDLGATVTPDNLSTSMQEYARTPATPVTLVWRPTESDELFTDPNSVTIASDKDRRGALTMAIADLPAAVGLHVRMTAVYEWQPITGTGLNTPVQSVTASRSSTRDVLGALDRMGHWYTYGLERMGAIGQATRRMSNMFGMMPSVGMRASVPLLGY